MYAHRIADLGFETAEQKRKDRKGLYAVKPADKLSGRELMLHLCDDGPEQCGSCGGCAYGIEMARWRKAVDGMTQKQIGEKYRATGTDVSRAIKKAEKAGKIQAGKRWAALYDEREAAKGLAMVWRERAERHIRAAEEWQTRANEAERMAAGLATQPSPADGTDEKRFSGLVEEEFG